MESRFCPYTFTPTSVRIPVDSILIRLIMGCVHPLVTPGICNLALSSLMTSFLLIPFLHSDCGFSSTMVSIMLIGELSVAVFALPALPKTFFTSGTDLMSLSCTCKMRFASLLLTSGSVTGMNKIEPSSSGGINSLPRLISMGILMANAMMFTASVVFRHLIQVRMTGSYIFSNMRFTGFLVSGLKRPFRKKEIKTGAKVITSNASTAMINVLVKANG